MLFKSKCHEIFSSFLLPANKFWSRDNGVGIRREKSQMHIAAQKHTLRSLQAPSRQNKEIIDGVQGKLAS